MNNTPDNYTINHVTNTPIDVTSDVYAYYKKTLPHFGGEAIYVYSFKENRMVYAHGWLELLGYKDDEIGLLKIVNSTSPRFKDFSNELNNKGLKFLHNLNEEVEKYSFTLETEKIHKEGHIVSVFSRVGVLKAANGRIEELIGVSQVIENIKHGEIMQFAAYGPDKSGFEETLSKELFTYYVISRKEKEALKLAAEGLAFKEIAKKLNVSASAIEKRIIPMYKRFNVHSLSHLISFAHTNHIL